jgi:perosamine synthetase
MLLMQLELVSIQLWAGNLGKAAAFSLFATKIITSGEGGIITTNDDRIR